MTEETWWTADAVEEVEASKRQWETYCANREKEVRDSLKELTQFCADGKKIQKDNDTALQRLHEELGKMTGAASQQGLTALLIAPEETPAAGQPKAIRQKRRGSRKGAVALLGGDDASILRGAIEHTRERGQRFNFARIEAWLDEIKKAVQLGNYDLVRRALGGLKADVG